MQLLSSLHMNGPVRVRSTECGQKNLRWVSITGHWALPTWYSNTWVRLPRVSGYSMKITELRAWRNSATGWSLKRRSKDFKKAHLSQTEIAWVISRGYKVWKQESDLSTAWPSNSVAMKEKVLKEILNECQLKLTSDIPNIPCFSVKETHIVMRQTFITAVPQRGYFSYAWLVYF